MTWSLKEVIDALAEKSKDFDEPTNDLIDMKLFDLKTQIGIGVDGIGQRILVLPGQEKVSGFKTKNADFDPVCKVSWLEQGMSLPSMATLTCRADFSSKPVIEAIAVVFLGLIELQESFQNAGRAIWEMKELFENGFQASYSEETLIGLIGEVLFINEIASPETIIRFWHSDPIAAFDFSSEALRLEVKTSRSNRRHHKFSSNQIGTSLDPKVIVASLVLQPVEVGQNLAGLAKNVCERLSSNDAQMFLERVIGILGGPIAFTDEFQFDSSEVRRSLVFIQGISVPRPTATQGVLSMSWTADLSDLPICELSIQQLVDRF